MYTRHNQRGFSLVETLVAITILLIVISGPMAISSRAAKSTTYASEQVVAFFLAQEGAEIAQKLRDDLVLREFEGLTNTAWQQFSDDTGAGAYSDCFISHNVYGCGLELIAGDTAGAVAAPIDCTSTGNACTLRFDETGERSRYKHSAGTPTAYKRIIKFNRLDDHQVRVESTVSWRSGSLRDEQSVTVETFLLDVYR